MNTIVELLNSSILSETNVVQVHADASNFASNVTKEEAYKQVLESAEVLFEGQRNWVKFQSCHPSSMPPNSSQGLVRISKLLSKSLPMTHHVDTFLIETQQQSSKYGVPVMARI